MEEATVERVPDDQVDGVAEWVRRTDDDDVRGVDVLQVDLEGRWSWQVSVSVAEFLREDPLESEMRTAVAAALRSVAGVTDVAEEDREVWVLNGSPDGEAVVMAVGDAVDALASRAREDIDRRVR